MMRAPVPVKPRKGRELSSLTVELESALDAIQTEGASQIYRADTEAEQNKVAVRVRQLASKRHLPLSVARVMMDGKPCVVFGPRKGQTQTVAQTHNNNRKDGEDVHATLAAVAQQLAEIAQRV